MCRFFFLSVRGFNLLAAAVLFQGAWVSASNSSLLVGHVDSKFIEDTIPLATSRRVERLQRLLAPLYGALPKRPNGKLAPTTSRYALHRAFVQHHGWYIKGLEPDADNVTDWIPAHMEHLLRAREGGEGLDLQGLAILGAAFEEFIHKEADLRLRQSYRVLELPESGTISEKNADSLFAYYLMVYIKGGNSQATTRRKALRILDAFQASYTDWDVARKWMQGVRTNQSGLGSITFDKATEVISAIGENYASLNDRECASIKRTLLDVEDTKPGRVTLSSFYQHGLHGHFSFTEKIDYLRALGALDESEAGSPRVIVSNYIASRPQCLEASDLYVVCCRNECDDLMARLEVSIASPVASVAQLTALVRTLPGAPHTLSASLLRRLDEIETYHGNGVPLHGRLFAQWMHHVFPRECPFPHESNVTSPQTPDEWMKVTGQPSTMSKEDLHSYIQSTQKGEDLLWSDVEDAEWASAFLRAGHVSLNDAEAALTSELAGLEAGNTSQRLGYLKSELRTMFIALPKMENGNLGHEAARYALHRMFMKLHGWFIKGLEPSSDSNASLTEWVPSYLQQFLEKRSGERGLSLHELAAVAAALEDFIHTEARERLRATVTTLNLPLTGTFTAKDQDLVLGVLLMAYLKGGNVVSQSRSQLLADQARFAARYTDWVFVKAWLDGVSDAVVRERGAGGMDFEVASFVAQNLGMQFASFNDQECSALKAVLLDMEHSKPGRVRLSTFYRQGLQSHWQFNEKVEYLRALGALDETDPADPLVIVPNYVSSRPQCLESSEYYAVCCRNECEDLMGRLEETCAAPIADIEDVIHAVQGLPGAPHPISTTLQRRLREVAGRHGGQVPLHSRVFAQWMHHVFPRECALPHQAGSMSPQTPDEWMRAEGHATARFSAEELEAIAGGSAWDARDEGLLSNFLTSAHVSMQDAEATLLSELTGAFRSNAQSERLNQLEKELRKTFVALPKLANGNLGHDTAHYALHRLFLQLHGWFITGLEPNQNATLTDWVPSYLRSFLEKRSGVRGLSLRELAAFAAALEDFVHKEATQRLRAVFMALDLKLDAPLAPGSYDSLFDLYLMVFLRGGEFTARDRAQALVSLASFKRRYADWDAVKAWMDGVRDAVLPKNGFAVFDFDTAVQVVEEFGMKFATFNDQECSALKSTLQDIEGLKPGRVRLNTFYRHGLHSHWSFNEKPEYLRVLGALDETSPSNPLVIVPNYIASRPQCLEASDFYAVCCRNECEDLMGRLEEQLAAPTADVEAVIASVKSLPGAPTDLPAVMLQRLRDVSAHFDGKVPLHGRLFAQWMHHLFPRECPFPHEAGSTSPQTPDEWMRQSGQASASLSRTEIRSYAEASALGIDEIGRNEQDLPWSNTEDVAWASTFHLAGHVSVADVESTLLAELTQNVRPAARKERLAELEKVLRPTFTSLPKNAKGGLDHSVARYALHRMFLSLHGWFIRGLEPSDSSSLTGWVPAHLQKFLEERSGEHGLTFTELVVFGAALEDLVHKEEIHRLRAAYSVLDLPFESEVTGDTLDKLFDVYLMTYLQGGNFSAATRADALSSLRWFERHYTGWDDVLTWTRYLRSELGISGSSGVNFTQSSNYVERFGESFGSFNDRECSDLKSVLVKLEDRQEGRVKLSTFYKEGLESHWSFNEKPEYLRALGALDESDPNNPFVVIPNYVSSRPQCLEASSFYAVCCRSDCEDMMGQLEAKMSAPAAGASTILDVVQSLLKGRPLPAPMRRRLERIADDHNGVVRLHGRQFAHWMHLVFPRDCPLPPLSSASGPQTPDEWIRGSDHESIYASEMEIQQHTDSASGHEEDPREQLSWDFVEEAAWVQGIGAAQGMNAKTAEATLLSELLDTFGLGENRKTRIVQLEHALRPMYLTLPKNARDKMEGAPARYALHRLFMQQHGWFVKGLDRSGSTSATDWVPAHLERFLEQRSGYAGLSLRELAALAAALEDFIHGEALGRLNNTLRVLGLHPTRHGLAGNDANELFDVYLMAFLRGGSISATSRGAALLELARFKRTYADWSVAERWLRGVQAGSSGDVAERSLDYEGTRRIVEAINEEFGSFNDGECASLKSALLRIEDGKAGRIRLASFYRQGLQSHWQFTEKPEYLRSLGALDESDPRNPLVIVPNYLASRPQCLEASAFYAVCCRNACEGYMTKLESALVTPAASPEKIDSLVTGFPGGSTQLSPALRRRLSEIAARHGGFVPLHGRLFAQWMHHVFPRECPYPSEAGTTNPQTPDEWMQTTGQESARASEEQMQCFAENPSPSCMGGLLHTERPTAVSGQNATTSFRSTAPKAVERVKEDSLQEVAELPWVGVEELFVEDVPAKMEAMNRTLRTLILSFVAIGLVLASRVAFLAKDTSELGLPGLSKHKRKLGARNWWITLLLFILPLTIVSMDFLVDMVLSEEAAPAAVTGIPTCVFAWGLAAMIVLTARARNHWGTISGAAQIAWTSVPSSRSRKADKCLV